MQQYMRTCPICSNENIKKEGHSDIYVPGWIDYFADEECANTVCDKHINQQLIKMSMSCEEFQVLREISNEPSFMYAMDDLKQKDPIEYQLKMSQFKAQLSQTQSKEVNEVRCPYCNSTNVKKISGLSKAGSIALWGIFSKKVHKEFHCNNCNSDF